MQQLQSLEYFTGCPVSISLLQVQHKSAFPSLPPMSLHDLQSTKEDKQMLWTNQEWILKAYQYFQHLEVSFEKHISEDNTAILVSKIG